MLALGVVWLLSPSAFALVDSDADGMSDVWERKYNAESASPHADDDGDGQNNLEESLAGTDPYSAASVLAVTSSQYYALANVIEWISLDGELYQMQKNNNLSNDWNDFGMPVRGNGGSISLVDPDYTQNRSFYRLELLGNGKFDSLPDMAMTLVGGYDTDQDGVDDLTEIRNGLNPFDPRQAIPSITFSRGKAMQLTWLSVVTKHYQIQQASDPTGPWENVGSVHRGTGTAITAAVTFPETYQFVRITVADNDSDGDGATDWEEHQVGLNPITPKTDPLSAGDAPAIVDMLTALNAINVEAAGATANITTLENGGFEFVRSGGVDEITVYYTVSGTASPGQDYTPLQGTVTIPFGVKSVVVPVVPNAVSPIDFSESVVVTLQASGDYILGGQVAQQVNIIREVMLSVADYGAVGDGITDDTAAIQSAIDALEGSTQHNVLYFPAGTYRLDTSTYTANSTGTSHQRILKLGNQDLGGRDLVFLGAEGARLYSTLSPVRAKMLLVMSTFRSLEFRNMHWEKDDVPLSTVTSAQEPNGAPGVAVVDVDGRVIETLRFIDCKFVNCHRSVTVDSAPYSDNGKLRLVEFDRCQLLNPYGSNTINSQNAYGGGQQVFVSAWVGKAVYTDNYFDGAGDNMTEANSPGGTWKDGCHFGGPLELVFVRNTVKRMRVEAVFQLPLNNRIGNTSQPFTLPPEDGSTVAEVSVNFDPSFLEVGEHVNLKTGIGTSNDVFRIVGIDETQSKLSLVNEGLYNVSSPGEVIPGGAPCYLQEVPPSKSYVASNVVHRGGYGIVVNSHGVIQGNVLYNANILSYEEFYAPLNPSNRGLIVDSNVIRSSNTGTQSYYTNTIQTHGPDHRLTNNKIYLQVGTKCRGIHAFGPSGRILSNYIIADHAGGNDYSSAIRSTGIALRSWAGGTLIKDNYTSGFDVGVGHAVPTAKVDHTIINHTSENDQIAIDPWSGAVVNP